MSKVNATSLFQVKNQRKSEIKQNKEYEEKN